MFDVHVGQQTSSINMSPLQGKFISKVVKVSFGNQEMIIGGQRLILELRNLRDFHCLLFLFNV